MEKQYEWRKHFPYPEPRKIQAEVLNLLETKWSDYDVFVITAPTAFGKTALAKTLMSWKYSVSTITPSNLLVDQFLEEFPDTPTLRRMDSYYCEEWQRPCIQMRNRLKSFCKGCECGSAMSTAVYRRGPGIYNYWVHYAHKIHREVLVVDEAHNLVNTIRELEGQIIWQHDYKYPSNMYSPEQMRAWIAGLDPKKRRHKKIQLLEQAVNFQVPTHIAQRSEEEFNGKGTLRGEPEMRDCIRLLPVDVSESAPAFWPQGVNKIILMSATISKKDVESLGLSRKRVLYIEAESPIAPERRPIIPLNITPVTFGNLEWSIPKIAGVIDNIVAEYPGERGVIHATYKIAELLREHLQSDRYLFHTRTNKSEVYEQFLQSKPGTVLVASGMYEGIDLPGDLGRFQIIAKVPWQSLTSPAVKHLSELDPEWYIWQTMKDFMQACGRICRTPEDFGDTFVLDSTFERLYSEGDHLIPKWFRDGLIHSQHQEDSGEL